MNHEINLCSACRALSEELLSPTTRQGAGRFHPRSGRQLGGAGAPKAPSGQTEGQTSHLGSGLGGARPSQTASRFAGLVEIAAATPYRPGYVRRVLANPEAYPEATRAQIPPATKKGRLWVISRASLRRWIREQDARDGQTGRDTWR